MEASGGGPSTALKAKKKRLSLGVYPDVSLKDARERRDEARKLLANEIDPSENRKAAKAAKVERAANSFEVVAREWYAKHSPNWSVNQATGSSAGWSETSFPGSVASPLQTSPPPQLLETIHRIEQRGALETAHRALGNCGQVFCYAIATGRAERDPSGDLRGALRRSRAPILPPRPSRRKWRRYCGHWIATKAPCLDDWI